MSRCVLNATVLQSSLGILLPVRVRVRVRACVRVRVRVLGRVRVRVRGRVRAPVPVCAGVRVCVRACACACAWAPAVGMTHFGVLYPGMRACYIRLRSGWGSDGNIYNALRGQRDFWKPSGA